MTDTDAAPLDTPQLAGADVNDRVMPAGSVNVNKVELTHPLPSVMVRA